MDAQSLSTPEHSILKPDKLPILNFYESSDSKEVKRTPFWP
jgi:hypothetical protein